MIKYRVNVQEIQYGFVEFESKEKLAEDDVTDKAAELLSDGEVFWNKSDQEVGEIEEILED